MLTNNDIQFRQTLPTTPIHAGSFRPENPIPLPKSLEDFFTNGPNPTANSNRNDINHTILPPIMIPPLRNTVSPISSNPSMQTQTNNTSSQSSSTFITNHSQNPSTNLTTPSILNPTMNGPSIYNNSLSQFTTPIINPNITTYQNIPANISILSQVSMNNTPTTFQYIPNIISNDDTNNNNNTNNVIKDKDPNIYFANKTIPLLENIFVQQPINKSMNNNKEQVSINLSQNDFNELIAIYKNMLSIDHNEYKIIHQYDFIEEKGWLIPPLIAPKYYDDSDELETKISCMYFV